MLYSIVGTGNMAWFLANKLTAAGHHCTGVWGRNQDAAEELATDIRIKPYQHLSEIKDGDMDICFLALSDVSIETIAKKLSFQKTVLVHTAGSVPINVLTQAAQDCAVLWPVYSILKNNLPRHRDVPCAWEGTTDKAKRYIQSIAHGLTDVLFEARGDQRKWLHLSAVISNNFINHLMAIGEQICKEQQLPFSVLQPIIKQTFERIADHTPYEMQTGPAKRWDTITIGGQTDLLKHHPDWQAIYKAITQSIENMYKHKG
jgi:predicted short-subunit dehydrogenase-like oxidoreductase (DUF2520 family)